MASIGGITSYLDIQQMIKQNMVKERQTLDLLQAQKTRYSQERQAWSSIKSGLLSLKTSLLQLTLPSVFYSHSATSSDADIVTAESSAAAAITSYKIENITLARAAQCSGADLKFNDSQNYQGTGSYRLSYEAIGTSVNPNLLLSNSENNISTTVGGQAYSFDSGSFVINGATITIDPDKDTLYDVVSRINSSTAGVLATLEVSGSDYQLRIESKKEGDEEIEITSDTTNFLTIMRVDTEGSFHEGVDPFWEQTVDYVLAHHPDSPLRSVVDGNFMINGVNFKVDTSEDSLQDIINRINNSQAGISVFYDEELDYLSVSSKETGEDIVFGDANQQGDTSGFLTNVLGLDLSAGTVTVAHTDASVEVNDVVITPDGNTFTINGTTFTLHANTTTETVNVEVNRNTAGAKTGIENFIAKYNALYDLIESKNQEGSPLQSNRLLLGIRSQLRAYALAAIPNSGAYDFLRDVGIEFSSGKLSLDASRLEDAFRSDPDSVAELFGFDSDGDGVRDDGGFSYTLIDNYIAQLTLASTGDIGKRLTYIQSRTDKLNSKIQKENSRLYRKEMQLLEEYSRLAEAVARMTQQFQTASSQMSGLNTFMNQMYSSGAATI